MPKTLPFNPELKAHLEKEVHARNCMSELSYDRPDPLLIASRYRTPEVALICALFSYGNAKAIVRFLDQLDFSLLHANETELHQHLTSFKYRFQTSEDIIALFIALQRLLAQESLEECFLKGYDHSLPYPILGGLSHLITTLQSLSNHDSRGFRFLLSSPPDPYCPRGGALKRWMMFLRWMVRHDCLDMGLWTHVSMKDLIIPLDTHVFHVSTQLGLLTRKSADLKAAIEITNHLKYFDADDPVRYDFALYRIGQEKHIMP